MQTDIDVLIAGAGAGGLATALASASGELSIVIADAAADFHSTCNTSLSSGMIPGAGSRWQDASGVEDSAELFYQDMYDKTRGTVDSAVARSLCDVSARLVEWLADRADIGLELVTDFRYEGHSRNRMHSVRERSGEVFHSGLMGAAIDGCSNVEVLKPARLREVHSAGSSDSGYEVVLERGGRGSERLTAASVVLACNGYGADRELVLENIPGIANAMYAGSEYARGDALLIGESLGADVACMDAYQGHGSFATVGESLTWASVLFGAYLINSNGHRFSDETIGYSAFAVHTLSQPDSIAWMILDSHIDAHLRRSAHYRDILNAGGVHWAADVEELAGLIGATPSAVAQSVNEVENAAANGSEDSVGRGNWPRVLESPYGAVKVTGALFHTQGGLAVDGSARVLRGGRPVKDMYAVGGSAVGVSGVGASGYLPGNGLLGALGLGLLAGEHIVDVDARKRSGVV